MTSFEATLARMKELYTYGRELNEDKTPTNHTIEYKAQAADGNTYGIIRECSKYYIKKAQKGKESLAEAYDYLGGFNNKKNYEYTSYANALKNFELKMASINEACEGDVIISTLDPFKKEDFLVEATDAMKREIARQKQIMYNAAQIMNESVGFPISRKDDTVMYDGKNPEAETGKKGDEEYKETEPNPEYKGSKTSGVDTKAEPFKENVPSCEDQLKENCDSECGITEGESCPKCGKNPCVCEGEGNVCDDNSEECGAVKGQNNNCNCGDGPVKVDEPAGKPKDPASIGWDVEGQKAVNESEDEIEADDDDDAEGLDEPDLGVEDDSAPEDDSDESSLEDSMDDSGDEDDEEDDEFDLDDYDGSDLSDLDSELNADDDEFEAGDENGEDEDNNIDMSYDNEIDLDDEDFDDEDFDDEAEEGDSEDEEGDMSPEDFGDDDDVKPVESDGDSEEYNDFEGALDRMVNEVIKGLVKEDELHVFGKHPGYRKKPMELPSTGEDKNQWGEDWNDESAHSEAPFGEKIGDGTPFDKLVDAATKTAIQKISEQMNKKKAN